MDGGKGCGRLPFFKTSCFERNGEMSCFSSDGVESYSERKKCGRLLFIANQTHCFERNGEISCFSSDGVESYSEREKCGRLPFISKQKNKKRSSAIPNTSHGTEKPRCHPYYGKNPVAQTPLRQVIPRLVVGNSESGSPARGNGLQQPPSLCTH